MTCYKRHSFYLPQVLWCLLLFVFPSASAQSLTEEATVQFASKKYDSAIITYTLLLELEGDKKELYFNRGLCNYYTRQWDSAIADFDACYVIDTTFEDALYMKGITLGDKGEINRSLALLEKLENQSQNADLKKRIKKYRAAGYISKNYYYLLAIGGCSILLIIFLLRLRASGRGR